MEKMKSKEPIDSGGIKFTIANTTENNTPEKIEQRLSTLVKIAVSIARRQGLLHDSPTPRSREECSRQALAKKIRDDGNSDRIRATHAAIPEPPEKEIRIRLPYGTWEQTRVRSEQARYYPYHSRPRMDNASSQRALQSRVTGLV